MDESFFRFVARSIIEKVFRPFERRLLRKRLIALESAIALSLVDAHESSEEAENWRKRVASLTLELSEERKKERKDQALETLTLENRSLRLEMEALRRLVKDLRTPHL